MKLLVSLCACLIAFLFPAASLQAQDNYPTRSVRMIMPFPAGSGTDVLARLIAEHLSRKWGQSVVVDNMSGAGGNIGGQTIARATPDGHTLLFVPAPPLVINPFIYKNPGYDPATFASISMVGSVPYVLVTRPNFPAASARELVNYARANPGKVTYASSSVGSTAHLAALQLEILTGVQMVHVPYRGAAPALIDVMNGHVDMVFDIVTTAKAMIEGDKVKAIATTAKTRASILPNVPTMDEGGVEGMYALTWFGLVGPPALPPALSERIYRDVDAVLKTPEVAARIAQLGINVDSLSPADATKFFAAERKQWGDIVKKRFGPTLE